MPYTPTPAPRTKPEFQELYDYIERELGNISRELLETSALELRTTSQVPQKPREGMIVQADGTDWDPGEGAGTYKYEGGLWKKMGDAAHTHTLTDITDAGDLAALDTLASNLISGVATDRILGRDTAGTGAAEQLTLSQVLDFIGSVARGDLLVRGASAWARLAIGASGRVLQSDGTDPAWVAPTLPWALLQTNSPTSGSSTDFTNISQAHKVLMFVGRKLDTSLGNGLLTFRVGATSAFATFRTIVSGRTIVGASNTVLGVTPADHTTNTFLGYPSTGAEAYFVAFVIDYSSTTKHKIMFTFSMLTGVFSIGILNIKADEAIEHVRIGVTTGSFVSGTIDMYGLF